MKDIKKYLLILLALVCIGLIVFFFLRNEEKEVTVKDDLKTTNSAKELVDRKFLLEGFPIDVVPLYKLLKISSNKYIVNFDPSIKSNFDEINYCYYNVVLESEATQTEFLEYYKGLFEREYVEEYPSEDMVKGYIGRYKVSVAHYGSDNTGYIQVHLPSEEFNRENRYYDSFPNLFELDPMFVEGHNSYGLLNQSGGEVEYYKYFTVIDSGDRNNDGIDDVNEYSVLIEKYKKLYEGKPEYSFDSENSVMTWEEDGYSVNVSFKRDHGRIYLNIRGGMEK